MTATAVEFDPFSAEYFDDPTEAYRRLRDEAPVYFSETYGFYALSRFADVVAAHRDWRGLSSAHGVDLSTLTKDPELVRSLGMIIMMDPPEHDRFRALVSRVFTPRAVTGLEPMVREVVTGFLDPLTERDDFDVVADLSAPFPVEVISRMLGVPEGERQQIREWLDLSLHREPGEVDPSPAGQHAMLEMVGYFQDLVAEKRRRPADDMLTPPDPGHRRSRRRRRDRPRRPRDLRLRRAARRGRGRDGHQAGGQRGRAVRRRTPTSGAGSSTTRSASRRRSRRCSACCPRRSTRAASRSRIASTRAARSRPAHPVLLLTGAATRDPRAFERPDDFDIDRPPSVSIGFGHGVHSCLGAALARLESRIAIEEIAARWQRLDVDAAGLRRVTMSNVAGYANVPVAAVR